MIKYDIKHVVLGLGISASLKLKWNLVLKYFSTGAFWSLVHSLTPQYWCYTKNNTALFQSHILGALDFSAAICWFTSAENSLFKMYRSLWNIYEKKNVANLIWKKTFHFYIQKFIRTFLGLERKALCTSTAWLFHLA